MKHIGNSIAKYSDLLEYGIGILFESILVLSYFYKSEFLKKKKCFNLIFLFFKCVFFVILAVV